MAKKRRKKAARAGNTSSRSGSGERPKAPRTEAQIAASRASIEKARAARQANRQQEQDEGERQSAPHPADSPTRPKAFFTVGRREKASKADAGDAKAQPGNAEKEPPRGLTLDEMRSFRDKLISLLVSLWELADKGLTITALDGEEAYIWRSIDDSDTAFLADRILAKGRENPYVGAQVRMVIDHWSDARMVAIVGPRLLESAGWHSAHGLRVAAFGLDVQVPPRAQRRARRDAQNGHAGQPGATYPYNATAQGATYGAQ